MTDIAQLNQGHFHWVLVRSSTKDPEWQPARFTGVAGHGVGPKWDLIGFNSDVVTTSSRLSTSAPSSPTAPD